MTYLSGSLHPRCLSFRCSDISSDEPYPIRWAMDFHYSVSGSLHPDIHMIPSRTQRCSVIILIDEYIPVLQCQERLLNRTVMRT